MTHIVRVAGLALTVTGLIALVHYLLRTSGRLPAILTNNTLQPRAELIVSILLVVAGLPLMVLG